MNIDGKIAEVVHRFLTHRSIPVLSVHDSFIIDYTHTKLLLQAMMVASRVVMGRVLAVEANGLGLDEMDAPPEVRLDFQCWRETARGKGYLNRLGRWEQRKGREVFSPQGGGQLGCTNPL